MSTAKAITAGDLQQRVEYLASDALEGRFTGSNGHRLATNYIAGELQRLGLEPAGDAGSYFQTVPGMIRIHPLNHRLSVGTTALVPLRDFVAVHPGGTGRHFTDAPVIFGGFLDDTTRRPTREEAAGKFVILIYRNPRNNAGNVRSAEFDPRLRDAAAIATVNPARAMAAWAREATRPGPEQLGTIGSSVAAVPSVLAISAETAALLFGRPVDSLVSIGAGGQRASGAFDFRIETLEVRNVVAILRGSDAVRAREYVALGAHSDHLPFRDPPVDHDSLRAFSIAGETRARELGRRLTADEHFAIRVNTDSLRAIAPTRPDSIHNGADDDASGTAALLEIAEQLAAGRRPARSVLFVWHAAEELGLLGSSHFTDHPTVERKAIVAQLNLDMIGRGGVSDIAEGGPGYLQVIGWRRLSTGLGDAIERVNRSQPTPFAFDLQFDAPGHRERLYCRSDHFAYARFGIPVAFFTTGGHRDYHQVTDEARYLDFDKMRRVTSLVHDVATELANAEAPPRVDGRVPEPGALCVQ
ncbi:MAG: M28 family peptidase [Gemmatimonadales bacterium]|nr:M28 family peptidase [Gemmatimonadales bacterium]